MSKPREVLLVGSVHLADAEEVLRAAAATVGDLAPRLPDGETGYARSLWFQCQWPYLLMHPLLEMVEPDPDSIGDFRTAHVPAGGIYNATMQTFMPARARLRDGVDPADVRFDDLGYGDWGIESYGVFKQLQDEGVVPAATRFQVCIPTPSTGVLMIQPETLRQILPAWREGLFGEIRKLVEAIGADRLAIQWDCTEPAQYEYAPEELRAPMREGMRALSEGVPDGVELGYHLCYGDFESRHTVEPRDLSACVEIANALTETVARPIDWFHMPVPVDRSDDPYFAPLAELAIGDAALFLGLVHSTDGVDGTRARIAAAARARAEFGIATECGFGRRDPTTVPELLRLHAEVAQA